MDHEKRLRALNALPGSGSEPKDGVVQGTPVWQERLDKIMLVEHLKKKIMQAHTRMDLGSDLLLKSHAWLVKNPLLADTFSHCIRHVPPSQFDRVDILQRKLEEKRRLLKEARETHEDYLMKEIRDRDQFLKKTTEHLKISNRERLLDDIVLSWKDIAKRRRISQLSIDGDCLEAQVASLQTELIAEKEDKEEKERQFKEALDWMTEDRDKFKKQYKRMVEAHEQAKRDLEASQGTAEGMKQMIMVLSTEKTQLEQKISDLEEEKRKLLKQIEELRALIKALRAEIKRQTGFTRTTELALLHMRHTNNRLENDKYDLEGRMDKAVTLECTLRDDIDQLRIELASALQKYNGTMSDLKEESSFRKFCEMERDRALDTTRQYYKELSAMVKRCRDQILATKEKARLDLEHFKNVELKKVKDDFKKKTDAILRRNVILEKEIAIAEENMPALSTLNPLEMDPSKICQVCRRIIVFEGAAAL
jgi:chromosome segregation ATPase